jgi:hypothetical protein
VCSGLYWLTDDDIVEVTAHVRWTTQDSPNRGQTGMTLEGDCNITVSSDALTEAQIVKIKEIRADSRKLQPYKTIYKGAHTRDRIRFVCREFGKE